jgi:hypothetical protein
MEKLCTCGECCIVDLNKGEAGEPLTIFGYYDWKNVLGEWRCRPWKLVMFSDVSNVPDTGLPANQKPPGILDQREKIITDICYDFWEVSHEQLLLFLSWISKHKSCPRLQ